MEPHYFAEDGNFGSAEGIAILDTTYWTEDDWMEIEGASDYERVGVARSIAQKYINEMEA
jgi:hypothetical protein